MFIVLRLAQNIITDVSFFVRRMNRKGQRGGGSFDVADKAPIGFALTQICRFLKRNLLI